MKIVLVGAGNVAVHLGAALQASGETVVQVFSRTRSSAAMLADTLGVPYTTDLESLTCDADLYLVMLTDAALLFSLSAIVKGREKALFVHTSGSIPLSVWQESAVRCGVFYPLQTFSKGVPLDFYKIPLFVEAERAEDEMLLAELASCLSGRVVRMSSDERKVIHLAAVFACNFTNCLYTVSALLLARHGLSFDVLLPLIGETVKKLESMTPVEAQTGPAVRGDRAVMALQEELLQCEAPALLPLYRMMNELITDYDKLRFKQN